MTEKKIKSIENELNIAQAMLISLGVDECEMYIALLAINPFEFDDLEYFQLLSDELLKIAESAEQYEVCQKLQKLKTKIR